MFLHVSFPGNLNELLDTRGVNPEDFSGPVVFLCSEAANYMHGSILLVDGGWMGR